MRYSKAQWVGAAPENYSTTRIQHFRTVIHIEQGWESGTSSWFRNPRAQVSAHFGIPRSPFKRVQQFVDTDEMAYHCAEFNDTSIGIEHEGFAGQKLNFWQVRRLRGLLIWLNHVHGIPLVFTNDPAVRGAIGHGRLPEGALSHPGCPGEPVLVQVNQIIHQLNRGAA